MDEEEVAHNHSDDVAGNDSEDDHVGRLHGGLRFDGDTLQGSHCRGAHGTA